MKDMGVLLFVLVLGIVNGLMEVVEFPEVKDEIYSFKSYVNHGEEIVLDNVTLNFHYYHLEDESDVCSDSTLLAATHTTEALVLREHFIHGCFADKIAITAQKMGYSAVIYEIKVASHFGLAALRDWESNTATIPIFEVPPHSDPLVLSRLIDSKVNLQSDPNRIDTTWMYMLGYLASLPTILLCLATIRHCIQVFTKFATNLTARWQNFDTRMAIVSCFTQTIASLLMLFFAAVDPFGLLHIIPYPISMSVLTMGFSMTFVTTFVIGHTISRILAESNVISTTGVLAKVQEYGYWVLMILLVVLDMYSVYLEATNGQGYWGTLNATIILLMLRFTRLVGIAYLHYRKKKVVTTLNQGAGSRNVVSVKRGTTRKNSGLKGDEDERVDSLAETTKYIVIAFVVYLFIDIFGQAIADTLGTAWGTILLWNTTNFSLATIGHVQMRTFTVKKKNFSFKLDKNGKKTSGTSNQTNTLGIRSPNKVPIKPSERQETKVEFY